MERDGRQALSMAINRETVAQALLGPLGQKPQVLNSALIACRNRHTSRACLGVVRCSCSQNPARPSAD